MSSLDLLLQLLLCAATKTTAAKLTPLWRRRRLLLSRPATNALAASATVAVLPTTATQPPTTLYTYISMLVYSAYTTRKAHLPMNAQVKEEEGCLGDPGLSWIQPHTYQ